MTERSVLSSQERRVLRTVCDTLHPSLTAEPGDDAGLFGASASDLGVPEAMAEAIALLAPAQQRELRLFLRLIDSVFFGAAVARVPAGINGMSPAQRGRFLFQLARSRIPQLRSGFQAVKRLSGFLYYTSSDLAGGNRVWGGMGYDPAPPSTSAEPGVNVTRIERAATLDADICIVGSGAGGGVVAAELAARGLRVVVLEAGPGDQTADFAQREREGTQRLYLDSGLTSSRDLGVAVLAGACLGGGTTVNWQTSLRTPDYIRDEWAERSGCGLFTSERFTHALEAVWSRSGCHGAGDEVNANNAVLDRGCASLGYDRTTVDRNARDCDLAACGYCTFGCRHGGKQSTARTFLHDAQFHGDTTVVAECSARRVTIGGGRVTGVDATARTADGRSVDVTIRAPRVVVAAGGIQSPLLLLRSGLRHRELGRNLFLHPAAGAAGFHPHAVAAWQGAPQTKMSNEFARLQGNYGFRLEAAPTHPGLLSLALPWTDAVSHRRALQRAANVSVTIALSRDDVGGRITARRDGTPVIEYTPSLATRALLGRGAAVAARVQLAAGADDVLLPFTNGMSMHRTKATTARDIDAFCEDVERAPITGNRALIFSAHQMGTCRMGADATTAVCDERGAVFGVRGLHVADASAFPASSGVNPMITIMALARCVAQTID